MKFLSVATSALLASSVTARTLWSSSSAVAPLEDDDHKVPGKNPLTHCADPKDDILEVKNVDLDPNPPKAGQSLTFTAVGDLSEEVEEGAYVQLQVKYGLITIIKQTADLCETVKNVGLECPLEKGELKLTKDVNLPKQIPPGKYNVIADVYTKADKKITCMTATVEFHRDSSDAMGGLFKQGL